MATIEDLEAFFRADEWAYGRSPDGRVLIAPFVGAHGRFHCYATVREPQEQVLVYSIAPADTPADRLPAMAELLHRVNQGLVIGNFELTYDDGEVRYKTSLDAEGMQLDETALRNLVYPNVLTLDQFLPAITRVQQGMAPVEALAKLAEMEQQAASGEE